VPGALQSFQVPNPCSVSASIALASQLNGGRPVFGRPAGTCVVRAVSGSPLCRCRVKSQLASSEWTIPTTYHGTPSALSTFWYRRRLAAIRRAAWSTAARRAGRIRHDW
jgi:hypothetical protein